MSDPVTPNMGLIQPTVGVTPGIDSANDYNANFTTIDGHNHSSGSGAPITPGGISITSALNFNNYAVSQAGIVSFTPQGVGVATPVNYSTYFSGSEFYIKDGAGNTVQVTSGGNVNATSSGISSGTASASFVASVLVVNADTNKPANVQCGSLLIGNNVTSSNYLTLSPPNSMAANYGITFPSLPAANSTLVTIGTDGTMGATTVVDNATLEISGGSLQIKALGVDTAQIAAQAVTAAKIASGTITGTQVTSNIHLVGNSILLNGALPNVSTAAATIRSKTIYGPCAALGGSSGDGWTQARTSAGTYTITFTEIFGGLPTVVFQLKTTPGIVVITSGPIVGSVSYEIFDTSFSATDIPHLFIATGFG